ncbi:SpaH/EbpB family LPXTG-anchored major pilin [Enterococcus sp. CSURQ0835]|uniref:SpaH/EbpB family LPXTG-anchored major pilin n=1 Tax=Enterococcus sp. CSURQ0835 TaxID=2681394 RepID=UPI001359881D|nr:SpaH/EbpB family LPXTG-anchored major pilin [Enterococcus sp. CSURQ0835]
MKKLIIVCLVLSAILIGGPSALAQQLTSAKPEKGDLTIHKYYLPEGVAVGEAGDGSSNGQLPDEAIPLAGVQFDLYRIGELLQVSKDRGQTWKKADTPVQIPNGEAVRYQVNVSSSQGNWTVNAQTGATIYQYRLQVVSGYEKGGQTAREPAGELKFKELVAGQYLVLENLAQSDPRKASDGQPVPLEFAVEPIVVSVPLPIGDKWSQDVHVYPKNKGNELIKDYTAQDPAIGETVEYQISTAVPENIDHYQRFELWDELPIGHTLLKDTIGVAEARLLPGEPTKKVELVTDVAGKIKTIPQKATEELWRVAVEGQKFTVIFTEAGRMYLANHKIERLAVTFKATINEQAQTSNTDAAGNVIENTAWVTFTNNHGQTSEKPTNQTLVPLVEVTVIKQNENEQPLAAAFAITTSKKNATDNKFIRVKYGRTNGKKDLTKVVAIKTPEQAGYAQTLNDTSYEDYQLTTDATTGRARFVGLPATGQNYWIKELKAPAGYQLLSEPQMVHAEPLPAPSEWTKASLAAYGQQQIKVVNVPTDPKDDDEPELPGTAGDPPTGTTPGGQTPSGGNDPSAKPLAVWSQVTNVVPAAKQALRRLPQVWRELPKTGSLPATLLTIVGIILFGLVIIYYLNRQAKKKRVTKD